MRTLVAIGMAMLLGAPLQAQAPDTAASRAARAAVFSVSDAALEAALRRLDRSSPAWRAALDSVARAGGRVLVMTVAELQDVPDRFGRDELAGVAPIAATDSSVTSVLVVVNRELIDRVYRLAGGTPVDRNEDLMRILIHEVYGHAVPYLLAGHLRGSCPDPVGDADSLGCSVRRENVVRAELRLGTRRSYDMSGLALARLIPSDAR